MKTFDEKYIPEPMSGCWLWLLSVDEDGYGRYGNDRAHRESYRRHKGEISIGLVVRHICDQPSCVNPDHLLLGTHRQNMEDRSRRGDFSKLKRGEKHPQSKLTQEQADAIRLDTRYMYVIAKEYGVGPTTIFKIKHNERYIVP